MWVVIHQDSTLVHGLPQFVLGRPKVLSGDVRRILQLEGGFALQPGLCCMWHASSRTLPSIAGLASLLCFVLLDIKLILCTNESTDFHVPIPEAEDEPHPRARRRTP